MCQVKINSDLHQCIRELTKALVYSQIHWIIREYTKFALALQQLRIIGKQTGSSFESVICQPDTRGVKYF